VKTEKSQFLKYEKVALSSAVIDKASLQEQQCFGEHAATR